MSMKYCYAPYNRTTMELRDSPSVAPSITEFGANVKGAQMIDEEIERHQDAIRVLKTRRNELTLISQLPPELLSIIFQHVQTKSRTSYIYERIPWTAVSHVCGHWRRVALQSPSLWGNIDIHGHESGPGTWVEVFLERSKQSLLTLTATLTYRSFQPIKAAMEKMERMQELTLTLQRSMAQDLLSIFETHPAPFLQKLQIVCGTSDGSGRLPDRLFAGDHPSLSALKLVNCDLAWNLPPFNNLTTLHISNSSIFAGSGQSPTMNQLISILQNSPKLERIELEGMFPGSQLNVDPPILLPNLSMISLKSSHSSSIELLTNVSFPAASLIQIRSLEARHDLTEVYRVIRLAFNPKNIIGSRPPIRSLRVMSSQVNGGTVKVEAWLHGRNDIDDYTQGSILCLDSHVPRGTNDPCNEEEGSMFWSTLPLEGLECLAAVGLELGKLAWLDLSNHLERLTVLKLHTLSKKAALSALGALSSKRAGNPRKGGRRRNKSIRMHFPALCELSISGWDFETRPHDQKQTSELLQELILCIKTRKTSGAGIATLTLESCRYLFCSGVEKLKRVVPCVIWDGSEEVTDSEDEDDDDDDDEYYGYDHWNEYGDYDSEEEFYFF